MAGAGEGGGVGVGRETEGNKAMATRGRGALMLYRRQLAVPALTFILLASSPDPLTLYPVTTGVFPGSLHTCLLNVGKLIVA